MTSEIERFAAPLIIATLFLALNFLKLERRLMIANLLSAIMFSLYAGEVYIAWKTGQVAKLASERRGVAFDPRSKLAVITDLRNRGVEAYPIIRGRNLLEVQPGGGLAPILSADGRPLLPLAALPRTTVVSCNETGQWQVYKTDRNGFNNNDALWNTPTPQVVMVGDSFTHGSCLPRAQNIESLVSPRLGPTLNLGVGGDGPLLELAALKEYAEPLRPRSVFWLFFEGNDLNEDLPFELSSPLLRAYLNNSGFSQDLIHRAPTITAELKAYLDRNMRVAMDHVDDPTEDLVRYLSLDRVRSAVGLGPIQIGFNGGDLDAELSTFDDVIRAANQRVRGWGGALYLVYLPDSDRYLSRFGASTVRDRIYRGVLATSRRQGVPFIDVAAAFARHGDASRLFVYPGSHFDAKGYALAATTIADALPPAAVR